MSLEFGVSQLRVAAILGIAAWFGVPGMAAQTSAEPSMKVPKVVPVPPLYPTVPLKEPTSPPARDVTDSRGHLTFHLPAGWSVSRKDGEMSTFRLDARTVPANAQLHLVAAMAYNPFPMSTFEGAMFYVSSAPRLSAEACAAQTATKPFEKLPPTTIDAQPFSRGKDEHGKICTESRDVAYTALRDNACLRFDLAINNFCGGEVSGAQDLTGGQLQALYNGLVAIVNSVRFTKK